MWTALVATSSCVTKFSSGLRFRYHGCFVEAAGVATYPRSYEWTPGGIVTQGNFELTQICRLIVNQPGSSNVPAAIVLAPGRISAVWDSVVAQLAQKFILSQRPLTSERCSISASSPCMNSTDSSANVASTAKALASLR